MTDTEILEAIKDRLGITGSYQDKTLEGYILDVKAFLSDAGVKKSILESDAALGAISRGVSDLWNYGAGNAEFSTYFMQRAIQLCYRKEGADDG